LIRKASTTSGIRLATFFSDTHCGSTLGLLCPGFKTLEGNVIGLNAPQHWLWECWTDATEKWLPSILGNDKYVRIINADAVEGVHHGTTQVVSPDPADHWAIAEQVFSTMPGKPAQTFVTVGTECHTKNYEHSIAEAIGATPDPNTGRGAWDKLYLTMAGVPITVQHHISTTSRWNLRSGRLSIALANEQATALNHGHTPCRILAGAHCHIFDYYDNGKSAAFTTGAWQFGGRHVGKVATAGIQRPEPTFVVLDWRDRKDGELPLVHRRIYTAPEPKGVTL
jgi:hypothetical protein